MLQIYYTALFLASLLCTGFYVFLWHKHFNTNFTLIFTIVPIACLSYVLSSQARTMGEALTAVKLTYMGGIFLQLTVIYCIFDLCGKPFKRWLRIVLFGISGVTFLAVLTAGKLPFFYKSVTFTINNGVCILKPEYGFMHSVYHVELIAAFIAELAVLCWAWIRNRQVSKAVTALLFIPNSVCMLSYVVRKIFHTTAEFVPVAYVLSLVTFLVIAYKVNLCNISDTAIDSMIQEKGLAYISCDFRYRYLGSNDFAKVLIPELADKTVDEVIGYKPSERKLRHFLDDFSEDESNNTFLYTLNLDDDDPDNDEFYNVNVGYLYDGAKKRGYFITFTDDTPNRKYMQLIDSYNEDLKTEVEEKTEHIIEMHDNLIMSLAMMVESRDNSTGGHIKRTSKGVEILIGEMRKEGKIPLSDEFCHDVIKAAPMHDLGKIAVDDAVLRKPGRYTPEEYDQMKKHAAEGAKVIHEILLNTDDESFKVVAENVAHYHHERWDGSGYPEKLSGESIPLEARIMAIADVYDALVSKRVYKDAYDFKKADSIIMEGMGTQFDPSLETAYVNARPLLEEYYSHIE